MISRAALILPNKSFNQATLASHLIVVLDTTFWIRARISAMFPSLMSLSQSVQAGNPEKYPVEIPPIPLSDPRLLIDPIELVILPAKLESLLKTSAPETVPNPLVYDESP